MKVDPSGQIVHFKSPTQDVGAAVTAQLASPAGEFTASADVRKYLSDPIVRTAYAATIVPSSFCLGDGQTQKVVVTYAPIPSSNKLWMTNNAPAGALGFTSSTLATTSTQSASVAIKSPAVAPSRSTRMANVDAARHRHDAPIQRYAAEARSVRRATRRPSHAHARRGLRAGPDADRLLAEGRAPRLERACGQKISRLAATDIASTGSPTPNLTLGGLGAPEGMAFDRDGNLWVADSGAKTLLGYDAARLATSTDPRTSSSPQTPPGRSGAEPPSPSTARQTWASSFGGNIIYKRSPPVT